MKRRTYVALYVIVRHGLLACAIFMVLAAITLLSATWRVADLADGEFFVFVSLAFGSVYCWAAWANVSSPWLPEPRTRRHMELTRVELDELVSRRARRRSPICTT